MAIFLQQRHHFVVPSLTCTHTGQHRVSTMIIKASPKPQELALTLKARNTKQKCVYSITEALVTSRGNLTSPSINEYSRSSLHVFILHEAAMKITARSTSHAVVAAPEIFQPGKRDDNRFFFFFSSSSGASKEACFLHPFWK